MTRALLFAFRPILVDDEALRQRLVERVLAEEGIELPPAGLSGARAVADEHEALRAAVARTGREPSAEWLSRLSARLAAYRRDSLAHEGGALVAGVGDLLRELEAAGLVLGIVTGARRGEVTPVLAAAGLGDRLAVLVTAEDVARGKPDPEGFEVAIAALAREPALSDRLIHPHEVVAVEGRPAGLAAAGAAGIRTLAVGLGAGAEAEASVASLSELSPARLAELFPDRFVR